MIRKNSSGSILRPIAGVCLLLAVLETVQQHASNELRDAKIAFTYTAVSSMVPWISLILFLPLCLWMAERFPVSQGQWRRALPIHLLALFLIAAVHTAVTVATYQLLAPAATSFWLFWFKIFTWRFATNFALYGAVLGVVHARRATEAAREREQAALRLEASLAEARLSALREQLQPHFLFNTLNAMSTLALRGDSEAVTRGLTVLSDLLRFTLETQRTQEVPLAEELAFIDQYLELMMLRFGDRLTVSREIDERALDAAVPVMLMQPLVENAIRHGIAETPGPGTLRIIVARTADALRVELQDSGPGFRTAERRDGIGLSNTRARLTALHGNAASMECGTVNGRGGLVRVTLPYRSLPMPTPVPA
jgi:two-component system, LytTR family, sensor kinase